MTKVANVILYMLHKQVKHLNDKKVSIMLFLMDFNHQKYCGQKLFNEEYIKGTRHPEPIILGELFDIVANEEDLSPYLKCSCTPYNNIVFIFCTSFS